jgi:alkanesulfonate monooxygenase SsuD/methylene tetrahydromethanopterin reductase-like flavin-dependent oxidoreductase (luciferase family)
VVGSAVGPDEIVKTALVAEAHGFRDVWVAEDYFLSGSMSAAGMVLSATEGLRVTTGVTAMFTRHPALLAMEATTLSLGYPGRFRLGLGTGGVLWMRQMGVPTGRGLIDRFSRDFSIIRRLTAGETVTMDDGDRVLNDVTLAYPDPGLPLVVGAMGPRMLAVADAQADAAVLSILAGPDYVRQAVGRLGRLSDVTVFAVFSVDDDGDVARRAVRRRLAFSLQRGPSPLTDAVGISDDLTEFIAARGKAAIADEMPDSWVRAMTVSGTPAECIDQIGALLDAGATSVGLFPMPGERASEILDLAGRRVVPAFAGGSDSD